MNNKYQGFIEPIPDEKDFIFGGKTKLSGAEISDGHWLKYKPEFEKQYDDDFDTFNCSAFGTSNALEILFNKVFGQERNFSDRFIGIIAGTKPPGNDPKTVIEAMRNTGLVKESSLPFDPALKSVEEYYSPKPPTKELTKEAKLFLTERGVGYERVTDTSPEATKEVLKRSPLGVAVRPLIGPDKDGVYSFSKTGSYTHWLCRLDYEDGKFWWVLDSYEPFLKKLAWDSEFGYTLRYEFGPGQVEQRQVEQISILQRIIELLKKILGLQKQIQEAKPIKTLDEQVKIIDEPKYKWDTPKDACHSVRVICDEEGLSVVAKNLIASVINCESGFNIKARNENKDKNGNTLSVDYGICQYNSYWYIGEGKPIASVDEALNNPEKCVRLMISQYKKGLLRDWVCYLANKYTNYPSKI